MPKKSKKAKKAKKEKKAVIKAAVKGSEESREEGLQTR
jgi:hypothetical protein